MSTPHVAGAFAVLKQAYPSMSVQQLESRLLQSAHDLGKSGVDDESGYGRLDIFQATR
jgi:subtilisin family serine protease